jgi:hypothetical protein
VKFAFSSCSRTGSEHLVFDTIRQRDPTCFCISATCITRTSPGRIRGYIAPLGTPCSRPPPRARSIAMCRWLTRGRS